MLRRADMALGGDGAIGLPYWDWSEAEVKGEVRQQRRDEFTLCAAGCVQCAVGVVWCAMYYASWCWLVQLQPY